MRKTGRKGKASKWPQRDADIGLCCCQMREVPWTPGLAQAQASLTLSSKCLICPSFPEGTAVEPEFVRGLASFTGSFSKITEKWIFFPSFLWKPLPPV